PDPVRGAFGPAPGLRRRRRTAMGRIESRARNGNHAPRVGGVEDAVSGPDAGSPAPTTLAGLILSRAEDETDGLLYEDQRWSVREVVVEARLRADVLIRQRRPGPFHVGVLLENVPEFIFLLLGAGLAGAAIVGINPTRRGAELAR